MSDPQGGTKGSGPVRHNVITKITGAERALRIRAGMHFIDAPDRDAEVLACVLSNCFCLVKELSREQLRTLIQRTTLLLQHDLLVARQAREEEDD